MVSRRNRGATRENSTSDTSLSRGRSGRKVRRHDLNGGWSLCIPTKPPAHEPHGRAVVESVSDPRDRMQAGGVVMSGLKLAPQPVDVSIDAAWIQLSPLAPYPLGQFHSRDDAAGTAGEEGQQVELGRGQCHLVAVAKHLVAAEVDDQAGEIQSA